MKDKLNTTLNSDITVQEESLYGGTDYRAIYTIPRDNGKDIVITEDIGPSGVSFSIKIPDLEFKRQPHFTDDKIGDDLKYYFSRNKYIGAEFDQHEETLSFRTVQHTPHNRISDIVDTLAHDDIGLITQEEKDVITNHEEARFTDPTKTLKNYKTELPKLARDDQFETAVRRILNKSNTQAREHVVSPRYNVGEMAEALNTLNEMQQAIEKEVRNQVSKFKGDLTDIQNVYNTISDRFKEGDDSLEKTGEEMEKSYNVIDNIVKAATYIESNEEVPDTFSDYKEAANTLVSQANINEKAQEAISALSRNLSTAQSVQNKTQQQGFTAREMANRSGGQNTR